ncbi:unnamed protein product [Periconia digitata]|uniref:DNA replication ATP-dependent helicase/nuclease n=1 Tax=Periconia digitata TaxID=1303443 RepID=A0A9W4U4X5_9PLEO|nr:unnamed protein product [Periconia digitata]
MALGRFGSSRQSIRLPSPASAQLSRLRQWRSTGAFPSSSPARFPPSRSTDAPPNARKCSMTRQTSFFDQLHHQKHSKHQWHRQRNYSNGAPPDRHVVSGPPILPSSQTRAKLNKFQFVPSLSVPDHNMSKTDTPVDSTAKNTARTPDPKTASLKIGPPPSTPATRLPLAELIGNVDHSDRYNRNHAVSPEEQLCWRGSQPVHTPLPRKQKRARSSSPVAPSQDDQRPQEPPLRELRTPQADPVLELWNRYTNTRDTPSRRNVAFAHLISEASPRSSATAGSVSGLRRWASCGLEFPTSTRKKRKVVGTFEPMEELREDVFGQPSSDGAFNGQGNVPEKSKLALMMQKMRDTIPSPRIGDCMQMPSSSSPLPDPDRLAMTAIDSPLKRFVCNPNHPTQPQPEALAESKTVLPDFQSSTEVAQKSFSSSSDDFGDPDLDAVMVNVLDTSTQRLPRPLNNQVHHQAQLENNFLDTGSSRVMVSPVVDDPSDDDEFGLDEEILAADLEHVASLYDSRPEASPGRLQTESVLNVQENMFTSETVSAPPVISLIDDDDEFGDDIDADEFAAAEIAATQAPVTTSQHDTRTIQRYLIKSVDERFWVTERNIKLPQKILLVEEERTKLFKIIVLREAWYDTPCTPDSFVHVIGQFSNAGECVVDNNHNMIILHPDHLISATVVADSFGCLRRAVLQDRIKATSNANPPMLYGTLLHELFQEALKENRWDTQFFLEIIDRLLPSKYETILEIDSSCEEVKAHLASKLPEMQSWAELFVRARPKEDAIVRERSGKQSILSVNKLLDVEQHVWSPMYGLKGNIDATVQVTVQDDQGERTLTVPFEIKTGRASANFAHVAQTALYSLLLSNRYDINVAYGILYYLESSDTSRIPTIREDIIHMIIKRNELACYVRDRIELPPLLNQDFKCQKCYAQESCFLYHKLVEDGQGESLNLKAKERFDELVKSLKVSDQAFMKKWDTLLTKEESDMMKFRRELWSMLSAEREKLGRCFANVVLEPGSGHEEKNGQKINRYTYTFIKPQVKPGFSFTESQLVIGEPIVISDEEGHFALANGYVTNVRKRRITVAVDRRLHNTRTRLPGFDSETNQTFAGIMEVEKDVATQPEFHVAEEPVSYRLDKDEFSNGMAAARNNLIQIMDDSVHKAKTLRSLIVEGRPPTFETQPETISHSNGNNMNADQHAAISKVMSANDYALILGMPGTGKTTTIAHIIRTLVAKGKSVLLTSYTHTAVDNILLKLRNDKMDILRLGAPTKIHPEVREFATLAAGSKDSLQELKNSWMDPPVVATTCLTINHPIFNQRVFDYCIVDEASQITLPVCLGPIRMAEKFVLVGDHYQLPPLVQNKQAQEGGLDISLFRLLCEAHPGAVTSLEHQYRMCADIMLLSNTFIYSGRLKCGTLSVASRQLSLPNGLGLDHFYQRHHSSNSLLNLMCPGPTSTVCWLSRSISPSAPVVFINTDSISTHLEAQSGSRITNVTESRLATQLTLSLLSLGVPADEVGIIAFYRSQLALLRSSLSSANTKTQTSDSATANTGPEIPAVELHTADKFQGRDKEVVIVSCVRSNENGVVGDLLKDRRRINVALTRARSKLIILGSEMTLSTNDLLRDMVSLCRCQGWVIDVDRDMLDGHAFDEGFSQLSKTPGSVMRQSDRVLAAPRSPTPSPTKKRKVLRDITDASAGGNRNVQPLKSKRVACQLSETSPLSGKRVGFRAPNTVCKANQKGVLGGRHVLSNVFYDAL